MKRVTNQETRLNKYLAERGVASRRAVDQMIAEGRVMVDGKPASLGTKLRGTEKILVDGRPIELRAERKVYYALNKPAGVLSSLSDPYHEETVRDLLKQVAERIYPVGRLDKDSRGLMILTNDGELARRVTHPSFGIEKTYRVRLDRPADAELERRFREGIEIEPGVAATAKAVRIHPQNPRRVTVVLSEGRKRQIRLMARECGCRVIDLQRVAIGPIRLDELEEGAYRPLTPREVAALQKESGGIPKKRGGGGKGHGKRERNTRKTSRGDCQTNRGDQEQKRSGLL